LCVKKDIPNVRMQKIEAGVQVRTVIVGIEKVFPDENLREKTDD